MGGAQYGPLGATYERIEGLIGSDIALLAIWTDATKRKPGNPNPRDDKGRVTPSVNNVNNRADGRPQGNSADAGIGRLE